MKAEHRRHDHQDSFFWDFIERIEFNTQMFLSTDILKNIFLSYNASPLSLRKASSFGSLPRKFFSRSFPSRDPPAWWDKNYQWVLIFPRSLAWLEDQVPVIQASLEVHDALLGEPGGKHVLAVHLAPQVSVVLSVVTNWISNINLDHLINVTIL